MIGCLVLKTLVGMNVLLAGSMSSSQHFNSSICSVCLPLSSGMVVFINLFLNILICSSVYKALGTWYLYRVCADYYFNVKVPGLRCI